MESSTPPVDASDIARTPWMLDPDRSQVEFRVRTFWGLSTVKGRFGSYSGKMDLSSEPAIVLTVVANTLDTKNKKRDNHLRSKDFFDVDEFPEVMFVSESVTVDGEKLHVRGYLHAAGHRAQVEDIATLKMVEGEPEVEAIVEVDQRELDMTYDPAGMVKTPSRLIVKGRLIPDPDA
jgi:polyisoprenoid-binding protein YceI